MFKWRRVRLLAGLLVFLALTCAELWMVLRFGSELMQTAASQNAGAGLPGRGTFFAPQ